MHATRSGTSHVWSLDTPRVLSLIGLLLLGVLTATPATANASPSWELILDRPTPVFGGMDFVSADEGWLVAGAGLLHTTDGGTTWHERAALAGSDVSFADADHGWFVSYTNQIFGTTDGGATWVEQTRASAGLSEVIALSGREVIAVGTTRQFGDVIDPEPPSALLYTQDGGATWTEVDLPPRSRFNEVAVAGDSVWTAGVAIVDDEEWRETQPVLLRSQDRGATWGPVEIDDSIGAIGSLRFVSETRGFARVSFCDEECGVSIAKTDDGGATWSPVTTPAGLTDFAFVGELTGWSVSVTCPAYPSCELALHNTVDGGTTWTSQLVGTYPSRSGRLHVTEGALYLPQQMLRSLDGGETWQEMDHPALDIRQAEFAHAEIGYALDADRNILRTSDAGRTWEPLSSAPEGVQSLEFVSANLGFASGRTREGTANFATVSRTEDGGQTWQRVLTAAVAGSYTVAFEFVNGSVGLLAVSTALYLTNDGGETWRTRRIGGDGDWINAAVLAGEDTIWANVSRSSPSGSTYEMTVSRDGGRTWSVMLGSNVFFPETMDFLNADQGVFFGTLCEPRTARVQEKGCERGIHYTMDGGATWAQGELDGDDLFVRDLVLLDQLNGWAFGIVCEEGCTNHLLQTSDGGQSWQSAGVFERSAGFFEFSNVDHGWLLVLPGQLFGLGGGPPHRTQLYHTTDGGGRTVPTPTVQLPKVGTATPNGGSSMLSIALFLGGLVLSLGAAGIAVARNRRQNRPRPTVGS